MHHFDYDLRHELEFDGTLYQVSGQLHFAFTIRPPDRSVGLYHPAIDIILFNGEQHIVMSPNGEDEGTFTHTVVPSLLTEDPILASIWDVLGETIMADALDSAADEHASPLHL